MKRLFFLLMITFLAISYGGKLYATTCAQAVVIPSTPTLPYVSALTCGTTNDITSANSTACGSNNYKGGWEAVYAWTPDNDYVDVTFYYTGQSWTGIFLYQGCPTSGGACIGNFTSSTSSKTLAYVGTNQTSGTKISLTSGVTYYIVIDTYPTPNSPCPGTMTINGTILTPCTGTPDPGNTLSSANPVFPGVNFTLSLQNATPGTGVTYQWQSSATGSAPWTNIGSSTPTHITSQTVSTYYRCQVTCDPNTGNSNPVYVEMCSGNTTYPFTQGFDGTNFPPSCWQNIKTAGGGTGLWDRQTAGTSPICSPHSGAGMARFNCFSYASGTRGILVSQALDLPASDYLVSFWFYRDGSGYLSYADLVNVYYNTAPNLTGATLLGTVHRSIQLSPLVASQGWYEYAFPMPAGSAGNDRYVIFEGVSAYGNNIFMDDIKVAGPAGLQGYVYDYFGSPVVGATISRIGGISTTSGAGGYFMLSPLGSGSQQFSCTKTGYIGVSQTINIPEATVVSNNFTLLQPQMSVEPGSIFASMGPEETITTSLIITNEGNAALEWNGTVNLNSGDGPLAGGRSYCAAGSTNCSEYISRVQVGAIDNSSSCTNYGNYTHLSANVEIGQAVPVIVTLGSWYPGDIVGAWVDWDQNEVFDDGMIAFTNVGSLFTGNFTVPENAAIGPARLRIRMQYSGTLAPCGTTSWGEVEDYTVIVSDERWVRLESNSGSVAPFGGTETVNVILDASKTSESGRAPGETYNAEIVFTSPVGVPSVTVPVTLAVADPNLSAPYDLTARFTDHPAGQLMLKWQYAPQRNAGLSHFIVTRDQMVIAQTKQLFCYDGIDVPGEYCYNVYAVYESGAFSLTAGEVCVPYPIPPEIPLSNWALILGAMLIAGYAFFLIRKRM